MILNLPSESYLADQCKVVNVDAIFHARLFTRRYIARQLREAFAERYRALTSHETYVFNDQAMARRSLRNTCLSYLTENNEARYFDLCMEQFNTADNMTDQQAALAILSNFAVPQRQAALNEFYQRWHADAQVVDKWLAIQARSRLPDTLAHVQALMAHESFHMTNPNKVRALISSFCRGNPVHFHAQDGSGYRFLADQVITLNRLNPQIAARMVQAMIRWQRYDETRQQLMRAQLQRIMDSKDLSKDVFEVVSKSLG